MKHLFLPINELQQSTTKSKEILRSYELAVSNWEKAMSDLAYLNTKIDTFLIQTSFSSVQSFQCKSELLRLKGHLTQLLQTLFDDLGDNPEYLTIDQFNAHTARIRQQCSTISSQLKQLGLQLVTD